MMFGIFFLGLFVITAIQLFAEGEYGAGVMTLLIIGFIIACIINPAIIAGLIALGIVFGSVCFLIGAIKYDLDR